MPRPLAEHGASTTRRGRKPLDGWSGRGLIVAHRPAPVLLGALVLLSGCAASQPRPVATPIGVGTAFRPAPGLAAPCARGALQGRYRAHVELFARRRVVVVPAGIGLGRPWRERFGRIVAARCRAELRTLEPTGVVDFSREGLTVDDLFRVWGKRPLRAFPGVVHAYVDGKEVRGPIALRDGAEIVLEVGGYVPPHASFLFPPR